jgi:hypothetical protein
MARKVCPNCGAANELKAVRCSECGASLTARRRPPLRSDRPRGEAGVLGDLLDLFPGFTSGRTMVWVGVVFLVAIYLGLHSYGYMRQHVHATSALVQTSVPLSAPAIVAGIAALIFYCTGIMWLLYGYVCLPMEALLAFDGKRWLVLVLLALVPVAAAVSLHTH